MFEIVEKINRFKSLLFTTQAATIPQELTFHHLCLAQYYATNQQWLEAAELYLEWLTTHFSSASNIHLKEFFFCLSHIENHDNSLCIELGLHLLNKKKDEDFESILNIVLKKFMKNNECDQALKILEYFFKKFPDCNSKVNLLLTKAKILGQLNKLGLAHKVLEILEELPHLSEEQTIQISISKAELYQLENQYEHAIDILSRLSRHFFKHHEVQFELAKCYIERGNIELGESLLLPFLNIPKIKLYYLKNLFIWRYHEALHYAHACIENHHTSKDELISIKILLAYYHPLPLVAKKQFDELLGIHHDPASLIPIIIDFLYHHQLQVDIEYYQHLLQSLNQNLQIPYSLQILAQSQNGHKIYPHTQHSYPNLQIPEEIQIILLELTHPNYPEEELFLVGGAVLQLLKKIPLSSQSDIDLILISDRKNLKNYVPSRFIENLYVRDTRNLGGYNVDLKVIPPSESQKDVLSDAIQNRDFTICALFCDKNGVLYDPTGRALSDFEQKRLDTIFDAQMTLAEDPVRILRAFKYIARGYEPSIALDTILRAPFSVDFSNHEHFNQVLLKECKSFKNLEFITVLLQYDFFKYLSYCNIPLPILDKRMPQNIGTHLIQGLVKHKQLKILMKKHHSDIQTLQEQQESLRQNITLQSKDLTDLEKSDQELCEHIQRLKVQISTQNNKLRKAKTQSAQEQKKLERIEILQHQIQVKKQKNLIKQKEIQSLEEKIFNQYQLELETISKNIENSRKIKSQLLSLVKKNKQSYSVKIQALKKSLENQTEHMEKQLKLFEKNSEKHELIQKVADMIMSDEQINTHSTVNDAEEYSPFISRFKRYYEYCLPYALEQMAKVVSSPTLKAYLHAHIAIRGLQLKPEQQNPFKIHYHLKSFLAFLPLNLKSTYQSAIEPILNQLSLPTIESHFTPQALRQQAQKAASDMQIEVAIYFYHLAISLYAHQNKDKIYYNAYLDLAQIFLKQYDLLQLEKILQSLRRVKNLPQEITKKIKEIYLHIDHKYKQTEPIENRFQIQQGFLDFWIPSITNLKDLHQFSNIEINLNLRKNIYVHITEHTLYEEEFILAQIEYALLLPPTGAKIQWELIEAFQSQNPDIELLIEYAKSQGIPEDFHRFFEDKNLMNSFRRRTPNPSLEERYLIHQDYYPYDFKTLNQLFHYKLNFSLFNFVCFSLGVQYLEKNHVWESQFFLQRNRNNPQSGFDYKIKIEEANMQVPLFSWDSVDSDAWYAYGKKHENNTYLRLFCNYQAILYHPNYAQAYQDLLEIYHRQKDFKMGIKIIPMARKVLERYHQLTSKNMINTLTYEKIYESLTSKMTLISQEFEKLKLMIPTHDNFDLKKINFHKTILWRVYNALETDKDIYIHILEQIICLSMTNDFEYALAHFELARMLRYSESIITQYHLHEAIETWSGLSFMCPEILIQTVEQYDLELLKIRYCYKIYNAQMLLHLSRPENQTAAQFISHFKYLIENHLLHEIKEQQILNFLTIINLHCIQKIDGWILKGEYKKAQSLLDSEAGQQTPPTVKRIFDFQLSNESLSLFLNNILQEWKTKLTCFTQLEYQQFYIKKIIELATYLQKDDEVECYQKMRL